MLFDYSGEQKPISMEGMHLDYIKGGFPFFGMVYNEIWVSSTVYLCDAQ